MGEKETIQASQCRKGGKERGREKRGEHTSFHVLAFLSFGRSFTFLIPSASLKGHSNLYNWK
jgi:hypothetical protein